MRDWLKLTTERLVWINDCNEGALDGRRRKYLNSAQSCDIFWIKEVTKWLRED